MPFEGKNLWKSLEILNRTNPRFPIDLLARRPDDTERRYKEGDPLILEAIDHGKVLYNRDGEGPMNLREKIIKNLDSIQEPEEVEPTEDEIEAIARGKEEIAKGEMVCWRDIKRELNL